jgi:hypothetical protein
MRFWWQDVCRTSYSEGEQEHADSGQERGYPVRLFYPLQVDAADCPGEASQRKTIRKAINDPGVPVYTRSKLAPKVAISPFQGVIRSGCKKTSSGPPNIGIPQGGFFKDWGKNMAMQALSAPCGAW